MQHYEPTMPFGAEAARRPGASLIDALVATSPAPGGMYAYDRRATRLLALASCWSYSHPRTMSNVMTEHGLPNVDYFRVSNPAMLIDTDAYFLRSACGRVGVIAFRGTEPTGIVGWLSDGNLRVRRFRETGAVHGGFWLGLRSVWAPIAEAVHRAVQGGEPSNGRTSDRLEALYITGHGLGGGLAAIAAALVFGDPDCAAWRSLFRGVYTFGQPMVGDAAFAEQCDRRFGPMTFRHVYKNDLVPRLPPRTTESFRHFGQEYTDIEHRWSVRSDARTQIHTLSSSLSLGGVAWLMRQLPAASRLILPFSMDDHGCLNYLRVSDLSAEDPLLH